jgi:hypothetical protein
MKNNENHLNGGWNFLMIEMVLEEIELGKGGGGGKGMHDTWIFALQTQCEGCNESIYELLGGGHVGENMLRMWACFLKLKAHWKCSFCKLCQYLTRKHLNQPQAPLSLVVTPWEGNLSTWLTEQYEQNAKPHLRDLLQTYLVSNSNGNAGM